MADRPIRIQLSRAKGWRLPESTVKVDRSTIWGNPFVVGAPSGCDFRDGGDETPMIASLSLEQSLEMFSDMVRGFIGPEMHPHGHEWRAKFQQKMRGGHPIDMVRSYLRGKNLACWCPLDCPCHADVLLRFANDARHD